MRINDYNLPPDASLGSAGAARTSGVDNSEQNGRNGNATGSRPTDSVGLSSLSQKLNVEQPESAERQAKVDRLRAAVANGSYHVDAAQLARSIVDDTIRHS
ncbi:MAG: flagellar biosynthesis anti-sigma factor FlgM [Acidobacteria bacterium]|nr:flagellar biosynthesis anti-sigma factor FlgM [Acidobacteriota bacterium]